MTGLGQALAPLRGGRVLDAATGGGGFAASLADSLPGWTEIVGIDTNPRAASAFAAALGTRPGIRFEARDALATGWPDASFDTVAVANSLHHFAEPAALLAELLRLLAPGGHLVLLEMRRDVGDPARENHVLLHHWWAEVDRACGIAHRETYGFAELEALFLALPLEEARVDEVDEGGDPRDPDTLAEVSAAVDAYLDRIAGKPDAERLSARGESLRARVAEFGFLGATSFLGIGRKAAPRDKDGGLPQSWTPRRQGSQQG